MTASIGSSVSMASDSKWVPCNDALGQRRAMRVVMTPTGAILTVPPGESAVLDGRALRELLVSLAQHSGHLVPDNAHVRIRA